MRHVIPRVALLAVSGLAACFPTFQSPRIEPGLRVDAGVTVIADQRRNDREQGSDLFLYAGPAWGIGGSVELGLPVGVYFEEGTGRDPYGGDRSLIPMPYLKVGFLEPRSAHHLAMTVQGAWFVPANVSLHYGRDIGEWTPQVGVSWIFSGGPAGDDPFVTRYQEAGQSMIAFGAGVSRRTGARPSLQVGVLRNSYREGAVYGDFGQPTVHRTLWDLFVMARVGAF